MKPGDTLDPVAIGHRAIDIKGMMREHGYNVPQVSIAKIAVIPPDVQAEVVAIKKAQERYFYLNEVVVFECKRCGEKVSASWKRDMTDGTEFIVCGSCDMVAEVR